MIPVVYSPRYLGYDFGPGHPFTPRRLELLKSLLEAYGERPLWIEPEPASREDVLKVHAEYFVRRVEAASRGEPVPDLARYGLGPGDTPAFPGMDEAARALAGGTLEAVRLVATGKAPRALQLGGGLHHAQYDRASGFCVYNDLAIAIRWALDEGLRVAYVDVDVHHGDGVQWIFYDEPRVLTLSLHESGRYLFPGTGFVHELGRGPAVGTKLNLPLEPFTGDESWIEAFEAVVPRALARFRPDLILVQSGADAHHRDPLADLLLTTRAFRHAFTRLLELARAHAGGRIVFTLGGGYALDATPRVWALLYFLVQGKTPPEELPADWRAEQEIALPELLEDPGPAPAGPPEVPHRNRETIRALRRLAGL